MPDALRRDDHPPRQAPDPGFLVAFAIAAIAMLVPIWSVDVLPLVDWPQHVAIVSVLANLGDPAWGYEPWFVHTPGITTYLTFYYGAALLAQILPVEAACRLFLSFAVIGTPAGVALVLRTMDRPLWPALLGFVAAWGWAFYMGFVSYQIGIPLLFVSLALQLRLARHDTPAHALRRLWLGLAAVNALLFLTHALVYLVAGAIAAVSVPIFARSLRRTVLAWSGFAPSLLLFGIWFLTHFLTPATDRLGAGQAQVHATRAEGGFGASIANPIDQLAELLPRFNEAYHGDGDAWIARVWLVTVLALTALGLLRWAFDRSPIRESSTRVAAGLAISVTALAIYLLMPGSIAGIWAVSHRLVVIVAAAMIPAIPILARSRRAQALLIAPILAGTLWTAWYNLQQFQKFQQDVRGMFETIDAIPPGVRTYGLIFDRGSSTMSTSVMLHMPAWAMVRRGGAVGFTFMHNPSVPVRLRNLAALPYPGERGEWEPDRYRHDVYGAHYDYLLVRGGFALNSRIGAPRDAIELVHRSGPWQLWRNRQVAGTPLLSLRESIHTATVEERRDPPVACGPWDGARHKCPHADWTWVGPAQHDFDGRSIPCVWAHPIGGVPLAIRFADLPDHADELRGFVGIADSGVAGNGADGATVRLRILAAGAEVGSVESKATRGIVPFRLDLPADASDLTLVIENDRDAMRHFCFGGTVFAAPSP